MPNLPAQRTGREPLIIGGFAGFGWAEALHKLGLTEVGLEISDSACRTRLAAGHPVIRCDITEYPTGPFRGRRTEAIMSPVCVPFSKSGSGAGAIDLPLVYQAIRDLAGGRDTRNQLRAACLNAQSMLSAEPMRWYHDLRPERICMEQVPSVQPVWDLYAEILRGWGYSVATGVIDAAWYGAGQQRKRAVLAASRVNEAVLPERTHGGPGQPLLTSMYAVIGWGYTGRPSPTVTGGGTGTGGAEPFGNGSRKAMARAHAVDPASCAISPRGNWRPSIADCLALQGFRPDLPLHGTAGQQYLAVGNAVPEPLARAVYLGACGVRSEAPVLAAA